MKGCLKQLYSWEGGEGRRGRREGKKGVEGGREERERERGEGGMGCYIGFQLNHTPLIWHCSKVFLYCRHKSKDLKWGSVGKSLLSP